MRNRWDAAARVARAMVVAILVAGLTVMAPPPALAANVATATSSFTVDTGLVAMNDRITPSISASASVPPLPTFDPTTHYLRSATLNWSITVQPLLTSPGDPAIPSGAGQFTSAVSNSSFRSGVATQTVTLPRTASATTAAPLIQLQDSISLPASEIIRIGADGQFSPGVFSTSLTFSGGLPAGYSGRVSAAGDVTVVYDLRPLSEDDEAPEPPEIDDIFVECASEVPASTTGQPLALDGIGIPIVGFGVDEILEQLAPHRVLMRRTWFFNDYSGNSAQVPISIEIVDVTAPLLSPTPSNVHVVGAAPPPPTVIATDNCEGNLPVTYTENIVSAVLRTRTWSATDSNGNSTTHVQTMTLEADVIAPVISIPATFVREASSASGAFVVLGATATDNVNGALTPTCSPGNGIYPIGVTPVSCSATDAAGNIGSASSTVTVQDTTPPSLVGVSGPITEAAATPAGKSIAFPVPTATDAASNPSVSCSRPSPSLFAVGSTVVTCTATDGAGLTAQASFPVTVTFTDITPPVVVVPATIFEEATDSNGAVVVLGAAASDDVDGSLTPTCTPDNGYYPLGTTAVTCTATDAAGNVGTASSVVTVRDTTPATLIGVSGPIAEATDSPLGKSISFPLPTATDAVSLPTVECSTPSPSFFAVGMTSVTCTASDGAGNQSEASFAVTVTFTDTTPPVVVVPATIIEEATDRNGAVVVLGATASDDVDGPLAPSCNPSDGLYPLGDTAVECTATDAAGNIGMALSVVTVRDTTPPEIAVPSDVTVVAGNPGGADVDYELPVANDAVSDPAVVCAPNSGTFFPVGTSTVTCTATDAAGNETQSMFAVTVTFTDTTPPVVVVPATIVEEATDSNGAVVDLGAAASDDVDGALTPSCNPSDGLYPLGDTAVECTATDAAGNIGMALSVVTVRDTTPPEIAVPGDVTVVAGNPGGADVDYELPVANDAVSDPAVVCAPNSGTFFPVGTSTVTCTATDGAGNASQSTFGVMVMFTDTTPPVVVVPATIIEEATDSNGAVVVLGAAASDGVDGVLTPVCSPSDGVFPIGSTAVECTATDAAGNVGTGSSVVTVRDTTAPEIAVVGDVSVVTNDVTGRVVDFDLPTATDAVSDPVVVCAPVSGTFFAVGMTTVTCTATDGAGNQSQQSFGLTVTFTDSTPPDAGQGEDVTVEATGPDGAAVTYLSPSVTDDGGSATVICDPASASTFPLGTSTVTCTATDDAGNTAESTFIVTVVDSTPPDIVAPVEVQVETNDPAGRRVEYDIPTATDAVSEPAVVCDLAPGTEFPVGPSTVICTAIDDAGNRSESTLKVTVTYVDTDAPILDSVTDLTVEPDGPDGATVVYETPSVFGESQDATVSCEPASGSFFPIGTTTVVCSASDSAGNVASTSFEITVSQEVASPSETPTSQPTGSAAPSPPPRRIARPIPVDSPDPIVGPLVSGPVTWSIDGDEIVLALPPSLRMWFRLDEAVTIRVGARTMTVAQEASSSIRIPLPAGDSPVSISLSTVLITRARFTEVIVVDPVAKPTTID